MPILRMEWAMDPLIHFFTQLQSLIFFICDGDSCGEHCIDRFHIVSIATGRVHDIALTDDGALFYWVSPYPDLRSQQPYAMCGRNMVSIYAGKYWTASATSIRYVYAWGEKSKDVPLVTTLLVGNEELLKLLFSFSHITLLVVYFNKVDFCRIIRMTNPPMHHAQTHQHAFRQLFEFIAISSLIEALVGSRGADDHIYSNFKDVAAIEAAKKFLDIDNIITGVARKAENITTAETLKSLLTTPNARMEEGQWDPGGGYIASCISWSLYFKQWDPGK